MSGFDRIARAYRWLEYASFGRSLERCRAAQLHRVCSSRRALLLGDGDGRFTAALLAAAPWVQVVAVDSSKAMLQQLGARVERMGAASRLTTVAGDVVSLLAALDSTTELEESSIKPTPGKDARGGDCHGASASNPLLPEDGFDLVATHFFLDCLSTAEVARLATALCPLLSPDALWIVSEFATPTGWAKAIVRLLYAGFWLLTGLETQQLPAYPQALRAAGFCCVAEQSFLRGLLVSSVWARPGQAASSEAW